MIENGQRTSIHPLLSDYNSQYGGDLKIIFDSVAALSSFV